MFSCFKGGPSVEPIEHPAGGVGTMRKYVYLNPDQKKIIETSWHVVTQAKLENELGEAIFKRFFELDPEAVKLFFTFADNENMYETYPFKHHCEIFAFHIGLGVKHINDDTKLKGFMDQLGKLHDNIFQIRENYGREEKKNHSNMNEHFRISETAVQMALKDVLKESYNEELGNAWKLFYKLLCDMLQNNIEVCNRPETPATAASS